MSQKTLHVKISSSQNIRQQDVKATSNFFKSPMSLQIVTGFESWKFYMSRFSGTPNTVTTQFHSKYCYEKHYVSERKFCTF